MTKFLKAVIALTICLAGWALVPLASLPAQAFSWELFAEAYGEIFSDGFESGDTTSWSNVVGEVVNFQADDSSDFEMAFRIDGSNWNGKRGESVTLVTGTSDKKVPVFKIEARRNGHAFEIRARAVSEPNVWAESPWREVDEFYGAIEIEWRRALDRTEDGLLYVSIDDDLTLWLVDLDNSSLPLRQLQMTYLDSRPVAPALSGTFGPLTTKSRKRGSSR